jgi:hypothetical protein
MATFFRLFSLMLLIGAGTASNVLAQQKPEPAPPQPAGGDEAQDTGEPGDQQSPDRPVGQEAEVAAEPRSAAVPSVAEPAAEAPGPEEPVDDIIVDPELEGVPPVSGTGREPAVATMQERSSGIVRMVLRSRFGADVQWEDPREEVWEATQLMLLEATVRRSENLRFMVGIRARHQYSAMREDTVESQAERMQLDAAPTAGYADATLTDGLHLRAGYQIVRMGRFDVFSASNFLDGLDLRNGPATMPEAAEFAQPALRVDWDALQWLSLKAVYLPFFQPHIVELSDSDYALMPMDQASMDAMLYGIVGPESEDPNQELPSDYARELMRKYLPRSARSRMGQGSFSAFTPDPDLSDPQGALRITAHGAAGEAALTAGSALERLPAVAMTDEAYEMLRDLMLTGDVGRPPELQVDDPLSTQVFYNRFYVFALDGATDIGPLQLGAEAAYMKDRTVYAVRPDAWPLPQYTDILQFGLRAEYVGGMDLVAALEGFFAYSLYLPFDDEEKWLFMEENRFMRGIAAHLGWSPSEWGWTFETAGAIMSGPTYLIAPRIEARLIDELYAEVGAFFVGGPSASTFGAPDMTLGGLYDGIDQVFVGLRWLP